MARRADIVYEIIVADDASPIETYKEKNRAINALPHSRFIELPKNVGRARIRNRLANEAKYEWLLFMDCDAEIIGTTFITDYLTQMKTDAEVICGGLCHADTLPSTEVSLRYAYEKRADKRRSAHHRGHAPYRHFTPFNFVIRRKIFQSMRFDERIIEYGHEDTLFGIELSNKNAIIRHIDNPLLHVGLESNECFLEKTRAALRNLAAMEKNMQGQSSLLKVYNLLHCMKISRYIGRWFARKEQSLTKRLMKEKPSIKLFFIYKLGYYCFLKNRGSSDFALAK